ncbi:hypothetical protein DFH09DRAFT_280778 [Mycena vulgaris]|nr:hypothetical protein DFH09DRAFT_280778 [Mycena vulgaris]
MSFEYLQQDLDQPYYTDDIHELTQQSNHIQFSIPDYLYDAPPTLAPGGGAEALHPAVAAQWFANSGFKHHYPQQEYQPEQEDFPAVADAYESLEALHEHFPHATAPRLNTPPESTPSPLTLPVYSQSGFDVVALLGRVQNRVNPHIRLGPVDFTTSFVVVDVRRHDAPIVYCSPSFCTLTGYPERDVLGRNCRFLQAPPSAPPTRGEQRRHTSAAAVGALAKAVGGGKEAQVSVVNYRRDGAAFVNLVSIVPLRGEHVDDPAAEVVWFVGFQIDLTVQSEGIVERVRDGRYYAGAVMQQAATPKVAAKAIEGVGPTRERRATAVPAPRVSPALARLLAAPAFLASCSIHPPLPATGLPPDPSSHALHSLLLAELPDFVHVLSLKGAFLYVAPAVTRVLGWAPADLVGRALADVCFARDVVSGAFPPPPFLTSADGCVIVGRALKEASLPVEGVRVDGDKAPAELLRTVDLVFRARTKAGAWVWVEARGRLHVEPGKGRKAIVLVGRARAMASVDVGGELERGIGGERERGYGSIQVQRQLMGGGGGYQTPPFYGLLDPHGLLLSVGAGAQALLGWDPLTLRGTRLAALCVPDRRLSAAAHANPVDAALGGLRELGGAGGGTTEVRVMLRGAHGPVPAVVRLVPPRIAAPGTLPPAVAPARLMYAVRAAGTAAPPLRSDVFARLDPKEGGSWQYELQQLRFANKRLEEEIGELERGERERARYEALQQARYAYEEPAPPPPPSLWGYTAAGAYQLPMKRAWDRRDELV